MVWPRADVRDFADAVLRAVLLPARDAAATEGSSHVVRNGSVLRERSAADDGGGDQKAAAHYYRLNLVRLENEGADTAEMVEALLFLANFYKKFERYRDAEACCMRLLDFAGPAKQDAKALLREIHNIQDTRMAAGGSGGS